MRFFILLTIGLFSHAGFSQQSAVQGEWRLVTRMCMNNEKLIPVGNDVLDFSFSAGGSLTVHFTQGKQEDEMSHEEYIQEKWDTEEARLQRDLIGPHRKACDEGAPIEFDDYEDACAPDAQREIYAKWRSEMEDTLNREIEEERQRWIDNYGYPPEDAENRICRQRFRGSWRVSGDSLSIEGNLTDSGCGEPGSEGGSQNLSVSGWYYFDEGGRLYWVLPPKASGGGSDDHCGDSEFAYILAPS